MGGRWVSVDQWAWRLTPSPSRRRRPELGDHGRAAVPGSFAGHPDDLPDRGALPAGLGAQQDHPVGQLERLVDVVGHEQHRGGCRGVDVEQQVLHAHPGQRVERRERLVEQQHARVACQGTGQRRSLGHAAGHLPWPVPGERRQADELQQPGHPLRAILAGGTRRQADGDVGGQGAPRQQPGLLERERTPGIDARHRCAVDADRAEGGGVEPCRDPQQGRLATAAGAQDADDLAGRDRERDVPDDLMRVRGAVGARPARLRGTLAGACERAPDAAELDAGLGVGPPSDGPGRGLPTAPVIWGRGGRTLGRGSE